MTNTERQRLDEARQRNFGPSGWLLLAPYLIAFAVTTVVLDSSLPVGDGRFIVGAAALLIVGLVADRQWSRPVPVMIACTAVVLSSALGVGLGAMVVAW